MKVRTQVLLMLAMVATLIVPATTAGAETEQSITPDRPDVIDEDDPGPPIEELEAISYAKDFNVSVEEAARRLRRAVELDDVIAKIVESEGDRVAGYSIVHEPEFGAWIYLVGDAQPTALTSRTQRIEGDVIIETGANHSLEELVFAASNKRQLLSVLPVDMRERIASTDIDIYNNTFVLTIDENSSPSRAARSSAMARLIPAEAAKEAEAALSSVSAVSVSVRTGPRDEVTAIYAGENLHKTSNLSCTSGFAVKKGSARGLTSAGHCDKSGDRIDEHFRSRTLSETGSSYDVTLEGRIFGDNGDSLWYTTSQWESDNFYVSTTNTRDATGYENRLNMNGDYVCHYGIASRYSCGTVNSVYHDPNYQPECGWWGCSNIWVRVAGPSLEACGGDSGGPVFLYRTAYGVQSGAGYHSSPGCSASALSYMTFTAMDHVLVRLGVQFVTS